MFFTLTKNQERVVTGCGALLALMTLVGCGSTFWFFFKMLFS